MGFLKTHAVYRHMPIRKSNRRVFRSPLQSLIHCPEKGMRMNQEIKTKKGNEET
jgi:hypothetical protein